MENNIEPVNDQEDHISPTSEPDSDETNIFDSSIKLDNEWLNLETQTFLGCLNKAHIKEHIASTLSEAAPLRENQLEWLPLLEDEIDNLAVIIFNNGQSLDSCFYQYHKTSTNQEQAVAAHDLMHQVLCTYDLAENVTLKGKTDQHLQLLKEQLTLACQQDPLNYYLQFELGWYYHYIEQDFNKALDAYLEATDQCLIENCPFAGLAMRHLALLYLHIGNTKEAVKTAEYVLELADNNADQKHDSLIKYELARYYLLDEQIEKGLELFDLEILNKSYFIQKLISDKTLNKIDAVKKRLTKIHNNQIEQIQSFTQNQWQDQVESFDMPALIDKKVIADQTFEHYKPLLEDQAYPVLLKHDAISGRILETSKHSLLEALRNKEEEYNESIKSKRHSWRLTHQLGVIAFYLAAILFLAVVFIFLGKEFLINFFLSQPNLQTINWQTALSTTLWTTAGAALLSAIAGIIFIQFETLGTHKTLKQRKKLIQTLNALAPKDQESSERE